MSKQPEGVKRGGKHAIIEASEERKLRDLGMPVRCCDYWPECSHVLAWIESDAGRAALGETAPYVPSEHRYPEGDE